MLFDCDLIFIIVWSLKTKKLHLDLPGHGDEVFAVDWSPDSQRVVSGGRDKILKMLVGNNGSICFLAMFVNCILPLYSWRH